MNDNRDYSLDVIKILATIIIVFHHYQQTIGGHFKFIDFYGGKFYFGYIVELFFLLSGYFMYRYIDKIKNGLNFKKFFKKRYLRFFPLVALTSIVYSVLLYIYTNVLHLKWFGYKVSLWGTIISSLCISEGFGLSNPCINYPNWYISVLLICFIVFYILVQISIKNKIPINYLFIIMIIIGFGIRTYNIKLPFMTPNVARGYYSFFFGLLLYDILMKYKINRFIKIISLLFVILIPILIHYDIPIFKDVNYLMTFLYYPALIIIFKYTRINKLFKKSFISTISEVTFDVYLWHNVLLLFMCLLIKAFKITINLASLKIMICFTIASFIVGFVSYYVFEKPIKNRILM